ncbi:uncharacterized protein LOC119077651 [Bradysia coprophila]|uniref:uncharacterized protein LOC119077651 n=1 Tax=Bradysia coprophila TaxID=38358 RepID=UPI00187D9331|nr:uncharacterized protein LOC119077651 [Bradysia coprophila]
MSAKNEEAQNILPQSLGKLEIVPPITKDQEHHAPPVNLNPFLRNNPEQEISSSERERLFGPSCNCTQTNRTAATTNKELTIKKCTQFKPRKRHEFILKQPMLKTFVRCLHHCHKERKNILSGNESHSMEKHTSVTEPSMDGAKCNWSLRNEFDVDFKSLNLSENEPCTSSCDLHKSYSFRYAQSERKLRSMNEETTPATTSNDRTNQQNISCSQQAVQAIWSPSTNGDVTTDELACYFETIVHIPKKMSTMAEMMYI